MSKSADFCELDHEGSGDASDDPGAVCLVMASPITDSLECVWVHRELHLVAFERAFRRLQHCPLGVSRWLMDNGFACREERHAHQVQLQVRGTGKG